MRNIKNSLFKKKTLLLMCLPAIIFFFVFSYMPLPGLWLAFVNFNYRDGIFGSKFIGLENFRFLVLSGQLWLLTKNTILYNIAFILIGNFMQITVAILFNEMVGRFLRVYKKISQSIMFLPYFISAVVIGVFAYNFLNVQTGFINSFLKQIGHNTINFYSIPEIWPFIIVLAYLWQFTGYGSIVYFAAIMGIDSEMMEASERKILLYIRVFSFPDCYAVVLSCVIIYNYVFLIIINLGLNFIRYQIIVIFFRRGD
jgi:putative aldouronate transport system permease protein